MPAAYSGTLGLNARAWWCGSDVLGTEVWGLFPEQQRLESSAHTHHPGHVTDGQQGPGHVRGGGQPWIMAHQQPLARSAEYDFGGDHEAGQAHRVDPGTGDLGASRLNWSMQI